MAIANAEHMPTLALGQGQLGPGGLGAALGREQQCYTL